MAKRKKKKSARPAKTEPHVDHDNALTQLEISGDHMQESLNTSETDDDENEGVGNATIGRRDDDPLRDK